jgi:STI1 domain
MAYRLGKRISNYRIFIKLTTCCMMILTHRCLHPGASSFQKLWVRAAQHPAAFITRSSPPRRPLQHKDVIPITHTTRRHSSWWGWGTSSSSSASEKNMVSSTNQQETDGTSAAETSSQIDSMSAKDMKLELESYGIDTKAFLEKKELRAALEKARAEGLQPKAKPAARPSTRESTSTSSDSTQSTKSREERIQEEMNACQSMKARDMKQELEDVWGVSTRSLFEKSEFLKALAEARVDGKKKEKKSGASEGYAEYKDVEVLTDDSAGPRKKQEAEQQQSSNPFDGMGGMGGMGGIADMLKNMGGVGGASPFGGGSPSGAGGPFGSGNPFGSSAGGGPNMMNKVQEMMANPKVRAIMQKAQSNPRIMAKVQECMSNPAAMAKYANDPEVAEIIRELKPYL